MRCRISVLALGVLALACGSEDLGQDNSGPSGPSGSSGPQAVADAALLESPRLISLYEPVARRSATALAFNPKLEGQLWVTLRQFPMDAPCTATVDTGCAALPGEMVQIADATREAPNPIVRRDGNAWHFMRRPTSLAFGQNGNLATCGESRTDNFDDDAIDFAGPVLWASDPKIFGAIPKDGQNGTHIDMLHETPYCMGIAHETENAYWAFNGKLGALDRYDFNQPHQVGGEDHTDGEVYRYAEGEVLRVPEVPSHLALDPERGELYVADTGNARVVALDITSGTMAGDVIEYDAMSVHVQMADATLRNVVPPGTLQAPSGITLARGVLFVTDNETSRIHAFDQDGNPLGSLLIDLPRGSLSGVALGPDGKLYLSDLATGSVYRVDATE